MVASLTAAITACDAAIANAAIASTVNILDHNFLFRFTWYLHGCYAFTSRTPALTLRRYSPVLMAMREISTAHTISMSATGLTSRTMVALAFTMLAFIGAGCMGDQIDATNKLVQ